MFILYCKLNTACVNKHYDLQIIFAILHLVFSSVCGSHMHSTQYIKGEVQHKFEKSLCLRILNSRLMTQQSRRTWFITVGLFAFHM